ncbi:MULTISPECIES: CBS domain-containing protein [Roseicyclus]|uniref:CBS domain-containing protein n=1 Tax=Roseicyclus amphidinii TaxID=3034232 RepID=UPI0024E0F163|nr:CBS domain-containing protein [Roseicyclus sp. Amp-Y-6]
MIVRRVMSNSGLVLSPLATIREASAIMRDRGVTALPVMGDESPPGLLTDRQIVTRLLPDMRDAAARPVRDAMIRDPATCLADHHVTTAAAIMGDHQVRHLLVLERCGALLGVLSVDDIAENASEELAGHALGEIVETRA